MIEFTVKKLISIKDKSIGLVNSKKAYPVYFQTRFGIHTFGMRFPIDVIILDKSNRVVKIVENLQPFRIFIWNPFFNQVIELPVGTIEKYNISKGKTIIIRFLYS
jgi:uncharacterized membrane protein (UPF0127 family)